MPLIVVSHPFRSMEICPEPGKSRVMPTTRVYVASIQAVLSRGLRMH